MLDRRRDPRVFQGQQVIQVGAQQCLAGLGQDAPSAFAPKVDLIRQRLLALAQGGVLGLQRPTLLFIRFEEHAADLLQAFAGGDELALNLVRLAVQRILDLAQP